MKRLALLLLSVVLVPGAFASDPALAKKEAKANFYANITAVEPIMDAFTAAKGIKGVYVRISTTKYLATVMTEFEAGKLEADLLARETNLPRWRELQIAFRRLEDRGEIRGGRFVDGFLGEQFALPVAVESLRAHRKLPLTGDRITIAAADPLNLVGIVVPGDRIPAISGRSVTFRDGVWVAEGETLMASGL